MIEKTKLLLSASRALLFNIIPCVRFILVKTQANELDMFIYSERDLNSYEKDIYYAVLGEISGDFKDLDSSVSKVNFLTTTKDFDKAEMDGNLIYARHE